MTLTVDLLDLIRWYDIAILSGIYLLVLSVFVVTGLTEPMHILDAIAVSMIVFGLLYLFAGLFEEVLVALKKEPPVA